MAVPTIPRPVETAFAVADGISRNAGIETEKPVIDFAEKVNDD